MAAMVVVIITMLLPILAPVVISITRLHLSDSAQQESGKENGHYQQHSAVIPQHYVFHNSKIMQFMNRCNGVFTP